MYGKEQIFLFLSEAEGADLSGRAGSLFPSFHCVCMRQVYLGRTETECSVSFCRIADINRPDSQNGLFVKVSHRVFTSVYESSFLISRWVEKRASSSSVSCADRSFIRTHGHLYGQFPDRSSASV